jgi:tetratricopeptide (TPR) repeat protein
MSRPFVISLIVITVLLVAGGAAEIVLLLGDRAEPRKPVAPAPPPASLPVGQTVYVLVHESEENFLQVAPLVIRELPRQAFLLAARDELGLSTRDEVLREEFPEKPEDKSVPFEVFCQSHKAEKFSDIQYTLNRLGPNKEELWEEVINVDVDDPKAITTMAQRAEALSRGKLKDVLSRLGVTSSLPKGRPTSNVPSATSDLLWSWNEISVLGGLRRVHSEIREKGESPELVAALAVGYANLGTLTEYYYSEACKAYYARALLYAERLVRETAGAPWALWHRAYVRTQLGLHNLAAEDVAAAKKKQGTALPATPLPFFADVLDAFAQGQLARMLTIAETPARRRLALYLNLQAVAFGELEDLKIKTAYDLLEDCRDCARVYDMLAATDELGPKRIGSSSAFKVTGEFLRKRLLDVPGLPEPTKKRILDAEPPAETGVEAEFRKSLITDLERAGKGDVDRGEPSLSAVGHAIEEINFAQLIRLLEVERNALAFPVEQTVATYGPLVAGHPYAAYINAYSRDKKTLDAANAALLKKIDLSHISLKEYLMLHWLYSMNPTEHLYACWKVPGEHSDMVLADEMRCMKFGLYGQPDDADVNARYMARIWSTSSKLPLVIAIRINRDWAHAAKDVDTYERDYADDPLVMYALANRYHTLKRYDDAERCAKRQVKAAPSYTAYRLLAAIYKVKDDEARWKETLDEAIKLPPQGLEQAQVQDEIARDFMRQKKWKEAVVYADAAAQSYSAWSMITAARCHERLGDWDESERLVRAVAARYDSAPFEWIYWCHRTGHGDIEAANDFTRQHIESWGPQLFPWQERDTGLYYVLVGDTAKAIGPLQRAFDKGHEYFSAFHAAVAADRLGKTAERDAFLKQIVETEPPAKSSEGKPAVQCYRQLAGYLREMLPPKSVKKLNIAEVDKILSGARSTGLSTSTLPYFVGVFLKNRGDVEGAKAYLIRSAQSKDWQRINHVLACQILREMKVKVPPPEDGPTTTEPPPPALPKLKGT